MTRTIRPGPLLTGAACVAAFAAITFGPRAAVGRVKTAVPGPEPSPASGTSGDWKASLPIPEDCLRTWAPLSAPLDDGLSPEAGRAEAMRRSVEVLLADCRRNAAGDWDRWEELLKPYQEDLRARVARILPDKPNGGVAMEGMQGFPLFECEPKIFLAYIYEQQRVREWYARRTVVAAARWLKRQGIDLIVVPAPKMTEVYPEFFADHCPPDRMVVPHFRRAQLGLLQSDVEVVDLLPLLLTERSRGGEFLFQPVEPHWGARGMKVAAHAIADRLKRYDYVARARSAKPVWTTVESPYEQGFDATVKCPYYAVLTPDQQHKAEGIQPDTYPAVTRLDGSPFPHDPNSPVMLIGDSFNRGMCEQLIREINLPVRQHFFGSGSTQVFTEFVRDRSLLKGCKVIVWTVCMTTLANGNWPLPPAVQAAADPPVAN